MAAKEILVFPNVASTAKSSVLSYFTLSLWFILAASYCAMNVRQAVAVAVLILGNAKSKIAKYV